MRLPKSFPDPAGEWNPGARGWHHCTMMTRPGVRELIVAAIRDKQIVRATYGGGERLLCPHALGIKRGKRREIGRRGKLVGKDTPDHEQVMFYQFDGYSESLLAADGEPNWRCIPLAGLSGVTVEAGEWHTCDRHTQPTTCIDDVLHEVDY